MLHRFMTISGVPELRSESASTESDVVPEVEVLLPVEKYWEIQELLAEIRYQKHSGASISTKMRLVMKKVMPYVCGERERLFLFNLKY